MSIVTTYTINMWSESIYPAPGSEIRILIPASLTTTSGPLIRVRVVSDNSGNDMVITDMSIGERSGSTSSFAATPTRITFNSGNNGVTVAVGPNYQWSDWIEYSFDHTKNYFIHVRLTGALNVPYGHDYQNTSASYQAYESTANSTMDLSFDGGPDGEYFYGPPEGISELIDRIEVDTDYVDGNKYISESTGVTDSISILKGALLGTADTAGMSDSVFISHIVGNNDYIKEAIDNVGLEDFLRIVLTLGSQPYSNVGLTDYVNRIASYIRSRGESLSTTDVIRRIMSYPRVAYNHVGVSDSVIVGRVRKYYISDGIGITDAGGGGGGFGAPPPPGGGFGTVIPSMELLQ